MIEYNIIKLFLKERTLYSLYRDSINYKYIKDNYNIINKILITINNYYNNNKEVNSISLNTLELAFFNNYPSTHDGDKLVFQQALAQLEKADADEGAVIQYLETHRKRALATQVAIKALDVADGKAQWDELIVALSGEDSIHVDPDKTEYITHDLDLLLHETYDEGGLYWRLEDLNRSLGPLRKGNFGFIIGRPELGKTTLLASEVTYMARQLQDDQKILWFDNEEAGSTVLLRCYSALLGIPINVLKEKAKNAHEAFIKHGGDKILIFDDSKLHRREIETIIKKYNVGLIVFDVLDKVYGFQSDRYDLQLKIIYQWARELSKEFAPVIASSQASESGEGRKYLTMADIDSSKTGKPGEADWILGMGCEDNSNYLRFLSVIKNKLPGDSNTELSMRHGKFAAIIEPHIARFRSLEARE